MFKPLIFASLLLPLAAQADIKILQAGEAANCKLVKEEVCKTTSKKPDEACLEWHQEEADSSGADSLIIGATEQSSHRQPSLTGAKTITTTRIAATYFDCGLAQQAVQQAVNKAVQEGAVQQVTTQTIESRLLRLNSLKEKGLITEDEYDQKRQQILDAL
ncbi:SHOCT domain-containing protein [Bacterioplanoides sp.]|uniref:SHOCT domain-containing protein n=1 Tax=Bacterioplanoides sp. TaxID=2066072 RepID=UPI003B00F191